MSRMLPWGCLALAIQLFGSPRARAFDFVPLGEGTLPSGEILSTFRLTFAPGDAVPFHFHAGRTWAVIVSGTLSEDRGCGQPLLVHSAGSTLTVDPGVVHRELNLGEVPAVLTVVTIVPSCYTNYNSAIYLNGPRCEGDSGRSQIERVPSCGSTESKASDSPDHHAGMGAAEPVSGALRATKSLAQKMPFAVPAPKPAFEPRDTALAALSVSTHPSP